MNSTLGNAKLFYGVVETAGCGVLHITVAADAVRQSGKSMSMQAQYSSNSVEKQ